VCVHLYFVRRLQHKFTQTLLLRLSHVAYVERRGVNWVEMKSRTYYPRQKCTADATFWRYVCAVIPGSSLDRDVKQKWG